MTINEYQEKAHTFANYNEGYKEPAFKTFIYPVMNLAGECGEVCGKFAKVYRDEQGHFSEESFRLIKKELGDICWFVAELCTCLGVRMEDVMKLNIDKLTDRFNRGVIGGSGDER